MAGLLSDLRSGVRALSRRPLMVVVVVLTLGLGIGATTTVFSVANAFLLRTAAVVPKPERLVAVCATRESGDPNGPLSFPEYRDVVASAEAIEEAAALGFDALNLDQGGRPVLAQVATGAYLRLLGIVPVLGLGPADPLSLVSVSVLIFAVALGACAVPARRAVRLDPMSVLRSE